MQRIELDNFRVFGTPAGFDLAPVTVLTGKNNSGKSSLIKAFLVLADYLEQDDQTVLRLDGPRASRHRISDWTNLKNWDSPNSENLILRYKQGEMQFSFEFEHSGTIANKTSSLPPRLHRFRIDIAGIDRMTLQSIGAGSAYQLDVSQKFIDYVAGTPKEQKKLREVATYAHQVSEQLHNLETLNSKLDSADQPEEFPRLLEQRQQLEAKVKNLQSLQAQGQKSAGLFFQAEVNPAKLSEHPTLGALIKAALEAYLMDNMPLDEVFTNFDIIAEYGLEEDEFGTVNPERLQQAKLDWQQKRSDETERRQLKLSAEQSERILFRFRSAIESAYFTVEHLSANRTHQARLYLTGAGHYSEINTIAESFQQFGQFTEGGAQEFLATWLSKFEIGESVDITLVDNVAIRIEIIKGTQRVNLADLGFGTGQVLAILLQIAALIQRQESGKEPNRIKYRLKLILIEEPEANLHPQFQSLLAELFAEMAKSRYRMQFVLETHSEYLIRSIQVLVKEGGKHAAFRRFITDGGSLKLVEENIELFKIYYLDKPSETNGHNYGHEMRLREDGIFMDEFGTGFLDESATLTFDLL